MRKNNSFFLSGRRAMVAVAVAACMLLLICLVPAAQAQEANTSSAAPAAAKSAAPGSSGDLNFELFDDKPADTAAQTQQQVQKMLTIEHQARLRRRMLTAHQAFGFSTLAVFAATLVIGQLNYQDKYVNGDFSGRYELAHLGLGTATAAMFTTTGLLALFAPNPYPKKYRFDTAMVHRVAMALATAGMVTQMVLGPIIDTHAGRLDQPRLALGHLVVGYASFAFMLTGTLAYVF